LSRKTSGVSRRDQICRLVGSFYPIYGHAANFAHGIRLK
jgi:hypothetical protein